MTLCLHSPCTADFYNERLNLYWGESSMPRKISVCLTTGQALPSSADWLIHKLCDFFLFFSLEILGSKETPYSGGSFKLEIQLPERLVHTLYIYYCCHPWHFFLCFEPQERSQCVGNSDIVHIALSIWVGSFDSLLRVKLL